MTGEDDNATPVRAVSGFEAASRRVAEHPGWIEHVRCESLLWQLKAVFRPNLIELLRVLEAAAKDEGLALQIIQNTAPPIVREQFQRLVAQRLHNYLAGAGTVVEHARRIMRGRSGSLADEYERRKAVLLDEPEHRFVIDLRNYNLHNTVPPIGHVLSGSGGPDVSLDSKVVLNCEALLLWDEWTAQSKSYLTSLVGDVDLRDVIRRHGEQFEDLNTWLCSALGEANEPAMVEVNRLIVEANAILMGISFEEAERYTIENSAQRALPPGF
jgi:hypothetical protein